MKWMVIGVICFTLVAIARGSTCSSVEGTLTSPSTVTFNTEFEADGAPACPNQGSQAWYDFTFPCTGAVTFDTCFPETDYDTSLGFHNSACTTANQVCFDDFPEAEEPTACSQYKARQTLTGDGGLSIKVSVGGYLTAEGDFKLTVSSCVPNDCYPECTAANEECSGSPNYVCECASPLWTGDVGACTCANELFSESSDCLECDNVLLDPAVDCLECQNPLLDPASGCTSCIVPALSASSDCTACINTEQDASTNCTSCIGGGDDCFNDNNNIDTGASGPGADDETSGSFPTEIVAGSAIVVVGAAGAAFVVQRRASNTESAVAAAAAAAKTGKGGDSGDELAGTAGDMLKKEELTPAAPEATQQETAAGNTDVQPAPVESKAKSGLNGEKRGGASGAGGAGARPRGRSAGRERGKSSEGQRGRSKSRTRGNSGGDNGGRPRGNSGGRKTSNSGGGRPSAPKSGPTGAPVSLLNSPGGRGRSASPTKNRQGRPSRSRSGSPSKQNRSPGRNVNFRSDKV